MQNNSRKLKSPIALFIIALMFISTASAVIPFIWPKRFYWAVPESNLPITVYKDENRTLPWSQVDENLGPLTNTTSKGFWIYNPNNRAVLVGVFNEAAANVTAVWTPYSQTIEPFNGAWFNLTLTPVLTSEGGSYSFEFEGGTA